jgi:hypothetical protein
MGYFKKKSSGRLKGLKFNGYIMEIRTTAISISKQHKDRGRTRLISLLTPRATSKHKTAKFRKFSKIISLIFLHPLYPHICRNLCKLWQTESLPR